MNHKSRKIVAYCFLVAMAVAIPVISIIKDLHRDKVLDIYVLSLEHGRSVFIRTPDDVRILVDGGANSEVIREITKILPFYSRRIDTIIATHEDGVDIGGFIDILERYDVGRVILPEFTAESLGLASSTDDFYRLFLEKIAEQGLPIEKVSMDDHIILDKNENAGESTGRGSITADVLFPAKTDDFEYSKASAPEMILKIYHGSSSVVVFNGTTSKIQKFIVSNSQDRVSVLVASNSVTTSNTAEQSIELFDPDYVIYSARVGADLSKQQPLRDMSHAEWINVKEKGVVHFVSDGMQVVFK